MEEYKEIDEGTVIGKDRFFIGEMIGCGGFGEIYHAVDKDNNDRPVAVKVCRVDYFRPKSGKNDSNKSGPSILDDKNVLSKCHPDLRVEYNVMKEMENDIGFPKVYKLGMFGKESYLVMELLGPSLSSVLREKHYTFSIKTMLIIMDQMLERLEMIHSKGIVHGDVTPNNILLGTGENCGLLYLIDFGLSSMFINPKTGVHLPKVMNRVIGGGTPRYISISIHEGYQRSRRDDMVSLAYVMAQFSTHGQLPWEKFEMARDFRAMFQMKREMTREELFDGMPREFAVFLKQVQSLRYDEKPDYHGYRLMFRRLGVMFGVVYDDENKKKPLF